MLKLLALLGAAVLLSASPAHAADELSSYKTQELLELCIAGANDARWGEDEEVKCEQYLRGLTDGYVLFSDAASDCLPDIDRSDHVRRAFMLWGKQNWGERHRPAAEGVWQTLQSAYDCR